MTRKFQLREVHDTGTARYEVFYQDDPEVGFLATGFQFDDISEAESYKKRLEEEGENGQAEQFSDFREF